MTPAEVSANLRRLALDTPPFDPASPPDEPYGFITEFRQSGAVVTLAAFSTGDVSLYFSSGGGIIGGIGKSEIRELAKSTVEAARPLALELQQSSSTDEPMDGEYCFYVLTPAGRRVCRIKSSGTARADGPEVKLIRLGGALLTKVRENSTKA